MYPELPAVESDALDTLINPVDKERFQSTIRRLDKLFNIYAGTCPVPLPAPGLIITAEIRSQCELYLPISGVAAAFSRLYSDALSYQPILSSTPFHNAMSWADTFAALPAQFQISANPARLLESLLDDHELLIRFMFASFLPDRFYGNRGRYPEQQIFIREWLASQNSETLHCLDAACGTGEESYGLAGLLSEEGLLPERIRIDGWTLEPLEVWAASHRRFPHDRQHEIRLRQATSPLLEQGFAECIHFDSVDLTAFQSDARFDLILCNGLLGGPIIHDTARLDHIVGTLARLLEPGGMLLAADHFHGGWKQKCPQHKLRALFEQYGLNFFEAGEGIGGLKPDQ
jgi:SAM-dependent methyltransferase